MADEEPMPLDPQTVRPADALFSPMAPAGFPRELYDGLWDYFNHGIETGGFLRAVLEGDLYDAVTRAHPLSAAWFFPLVALILHNAPANAYGSKQKVEGWLKEHRDRGQAAG